MSEESQRCNFWTSRRAFRALEMRGEGSQRCNLWTARFIFELRGGTAPKILARLQRAELFCDVVQTFHV